MAIISWIIFVYLAVSIAYLLAFAIAGRFGRLKKYSTHPTKARIAILIPSYKDDSVIIETARKASELDYPADLFSVTVIADSLQPATIAQLKTLAVNLLEVSFEKSMKSKSLNAAFQSHPSGKYDLALILDADNVINPDVLQKVNHAYQDGWRVIQCHRTAKNKNTPVALLDALSEEVNNTIFRGGHRVAGLSCTLIGSGMAFEYDLLKTIFALPAIQNNPGEDREVDIELVKKRIKVEYIEDAYVFDEKVQRNEVFEKQRTRWIATQVDQIGRFFKKDVIKQYGTITYLNKYFQNFLLPRLLFAFVFILILAIAAFELTGILTILSPARPWWLVIFGAYLLTMALATPDSFYTTDTLKAFFRIPGLIISMLKALLKINNNKKGFIHTPKEFADKNQA